MLGNPRPAVTNYVAQHQINEGTFPSLAVLVKEIAAQVTQYGSIAKMPTDLVGNVRNDMYLASEAIRFLMKDKEADLTAADVAALNTYKKALDNATKFIPGWVKIVVAIALGLGTMVGWKRIVVTVGEKIGKTHLTYAQGACAEITAAATIAAADGYGLPVSHHACAVVRHCRHHGGQRLRPAMATDPQHRHGLGADPAGGDDPVRHALLHLLASVLSANADTTKPRCCKAPGLFYATTRTKTSDE